MKLIISKIYTVIIIIALLFFKTAIAQTTTYADNFTTQAYNRNDGTGNWSSDWIETNDNGFPNSGDTFIFLGLGSVLAFVGDGANNNGGHGINRTVNLTGASMANLSFNWRTQGLDTFAGGQEELGIFISNNNGTSFTQIGAGTIVGSNTGSFSQDISAFISPNTVFRLQVIGGNNIFEFNQNPQEFAFIDDLEISAIFGPMVAVTEISVNEDVGIATYTATLTGGDVPGGFTIEYDTTDNTAIAGGDYETTSGILTFLGTENETQTFTIPIIDNSYEEVDETFFINLNNPSTNLVSVRTTNTQTIIDDGDPAIPVNAPLILFDQFNGTFDYAVAGGTLRTNNDTVDPCSVTTVSTGTFTNSALIPPTASIEKAYLFWAHSNSNPDTQVTFEGQSVNATVLNQSSFNGPMYGMVSEVTSIVNNVTDPYNHTYTFTDLTIDSSNTYCAGPTVLGAWSLMIFYNDPSLLASRINLYNGFSGERNSDSSFTLDNFFAIDPVGAKTTVLSWEGDPTTATAAGEELTITSPLIPATTTALEGDGDNINGNNRPFNSTIYDGTSGLNTESFGIDLDTYDLESIIRLGETSVTIDIASGNDFVIINSLVIRVPSNLITGTVFEDINYPGGIGRSQTNSNGINVANAIVELYLENPVIPGTFILQDIDTTDSSGKYVFAGMPDGNYKVRVVNSSVRSNRIGGSTCSQCMPIQTFKRSYTSGGTFTNVTTEIGGKNSSNEDTPAVTTLGTPLDDDAQSIANVTINGEGADGLDFGFNFNTIVNTNADGQGSLEQFIINANALEETGLDIEANSIFDPAPGEDVSIFMIPLGPLSSDDPLGRIPDSNYIAADGYFDILLDSGNMPDISSDNTIVDGRTQTAYSDTNIGTIGAGGTIVGTNASLLPNYNLPEIQVRKNNTTGFSFQVNASNVTIRNIAILGDSSDYDGIRIRSGTNVTITKNIMGVNAIGDDPGTASQFGIFSTGGTHNIIGNYIANFDTNGIRLDTGTTSSNIQDNHIIANGISTCSPNIFIVGNVADPINGAVTVERNLIENGGNFGISITNTTATTVSQNTIRNTGALSPTCTSQFGIRTVSLNTYVVGNIIHNNGKTGILVAGASKGVTISQNSIFANGTTVPSLGIDINYNGSTRNDLNDTDGGPNNRYNFPVFESVAVAGTNLKLVGWARPGAIIEIFLSDIGQGTAVVGDNRVSNRVISQDYGEGQTYLGTITEGSGLDIDGTSSLYRDIDNNTDNTTRFNITLNLSTPIPFGSTITATATNPTTGDTSEFGGLIEIRQATVITNRNITYRIKK